MGMNLAVQLLSCLSRRKGNEIKEMEDFKENLYKNSAVNLKGGCFVEFPIYSLNIIPQFKKRRACPCSTDF